jgi:acyl-CoA thioester hydrolase
MSWDLPDPHVHRTEALAGQIDGYGHVNNAVYVAWLDDCAWSHSTTLGLSPAGCVALGRGMAVWRTQINYLAAALAGDEVEIGTWIVANDGRLRIDRRFQLRRRSDQRTLVRALIHYVSLDLTTGRATRMPVSFRERYAVLAQVRAAVAAEPAAFQPGVESGRGFV